MTLNEISLDWALPSVLSGVLAFGLGVLWFHPKILGARWVAARGGISGNMEKTPKPFLISLCLWLLAALFYSFMAIPLQVDTISEFFLLSCLLWVGFAMPPLVMGSLYTGYPFDAIAIDASYQLGGYYIFALVHIVFLYT